MTTDIHSRLRALRKGKSLTIQQVSTITGIPASTYKEWENGRQIRGEPYMNLARVFEVSVHELITGEKSQASPALKRIEEIEAHLAKLKTDLISF